MPTFDITISRNANFGTQTYTVTAPTQAEAEDKAFQKAYDDYWTEHDADYELESVETEPGDEPVETKVTTLLPH